MYVTNIMPTCRYTSLHIVNATTHAFYILGMWGVHIRAAIEAREAWVELATTDRQKAMVEFAKATVSE